MVFAFKASSPEILVKEKFVYLSHNSSYEKRYVLTSKKMMNMGLKKHITGALATGVVLDFLREAVPVYVLKIKDSMDYPKDPVEFLISGAAYALTFGPPVYTALKVATADRVQR
ncbi:MAG: hypothetical protein V1818_02625 [Candidatus Aenigmatarchaeota archaeon]